MANTKRYVYSLIWSRRFSYLKECMKESKYHVLIDYHSEGHSFLNEEGYETLDEAVKEVVASCNSRPFKIVKIIDWEAV